MQSTINQCDSSCSNVQQLIAGAILSWLWLMIDIDVDVHVTWGHWHLTGMRCSQVCRPTGLAWYTCMLCDIHCSLRNVCTCLCMDACAQVLGGR